MSQETRPEDPHKRDRPAARATAPDGQPLHGAATSAALVAVPIIMLALGLTLALTSLAPQPTGSGPTPVATRTATPSPQTPSLGTAARSTGEPVGASQGAVKARSSIAPRIPWRSLEPSALLVRIGIGSCLDQRKPQPIWQGVLGLDQRPDLFLMIGDNVYGDIKSPDGAELIAAYAEQASQPELAAARAAIPFLATWDDHDYGGNDAGASYEYRELAARLFHEFWQKDPERPLEQGIHYARVFGPPGQRVQVIMLDTRSFRSDLEKKTSAFPHWGKYQPVADPARTMLGEAQWTWLGEQLAVPAEIRLLVSSVQVLAEGHGFERWGNLPQERERLTRLIESTDAGGVLLVSGDRHIGAMYTRTLDNGRLLAELTTSSLNRAYGPSKDARTPEVVSGFVHQENFGLIDIDWTARTLSVSLNGIDGNRIEAIELDFDAIGVKP
ncbi:MAG: alkaline phosphatase D family protein [Hyphomicrobiaceae bacterium]|nr:alkaline phosphatase D family protein [Hyphomicrobiaceae bacterium]